MRTIMSTTSSSISNSVEDRWVQEKHKIFAGELKLDIDDFECPCVFRASKGLAEPKPEAYTPQLVGLGPFHHQRLDLYTMQRKKLDSVVKFLGSGGMKGLEKVVETLEMSYEYQIRASYHDQLDLSPQALAWIIAIDSVYLLQLLCGKAEDQTTSMILDHQQLVADVLMLENQIPATFVIFTVNKLNLQELHQIGELVFKFCKEASPLELQKMQIATAVLKKKGHLLSMMYHSILDLHPVTFNEDESFAHSPKEIDSNDDDISIRPGRPIVKKKTSVVGKRKTDSDPAPTGLEELDVAISLFDKVWGKMTGLFKSVDPDYEANRGVEEIRIPSVYQLQTNAGFKIVALSSGKGIKDIRLEEKEKKLLLPRLTLHSSSEVILRNLCAYEEAQYKCGLMCEYVDLMCGIVDTAEDVKRLRQPEVISSELEDKEIAGIFSKKKKTKVDKEQKKSNIGETIDAVNKVYGESKKVRTLRIIWKVVGKLRILIIFLLILVVVCSLILSSACQFRDCQKL